MKNEEELENPGLTFVNSIVNIDAEEPNEWGQFSQYVAPLVKRAFPRLMANKIVGFKIDEPPTQKTWVASIPVKKNKQPYSLNPGKNYKRKNKW